VPLFVPASPRLLAVPAIAAPENSVLCMTLSRRIVAESLGTAFLLSAVVGSGIMAEKLASGNMAIALLANTVATGATLTTLIFTFGPISGAHFNPAVTLADAWQRGITWSDAFAYLAAQVSGAFIGVAAAHLMFGQALLQVSRHSRAGGGQLFSEFVATFGLLCVIWGCARLRSEAVPVAVGLYITGAYWFTASTSFANPAVTLARAFTDTFAGIRPPDAPGFILAQLLGAFAATVLFRWLLPSLASEAKEVVFPRTDAGP
jgi:glycerol uptake facilitator-like aquaporin